MYTIKYSLCHPGYIGREMFEDMWKGFTGFLFLVVWLIIGILNICTLGLFGFIIQCISVVVSMKTDKFLDKGYKIKFFNKTVYEKLN